MWHKRVHLWSNQSKQTNYSLLPWLRWGHRCQHVVEHRHAVFVPRPLVNPNECWIFARHFSRYVGSMLPPGTFLCAQLEDQDYNETCADFMKQRVRFFLPLCKPRSKCQQEVADVALVHTPLSLLHWFFQQLWCRNWQRRKDSFWASLVCEALASLNENENYTFMWNKTTSL